MTILFTLGEKILHGNQCFKFFPCSYALLQKNKKMCENLGYLFAFLQRWIAIKEKFKKLILNTKACHQRPVFVFCSLYLMHVSSSHQSAVKVS